MEGVHPSTKVQVKKHLPEQFRDRVSFVRGSTTDHEPLVVSAVTLPEDSLADMFGKVIGAASGNRMHDASDSDTVTYLEDLPSSFDVLTSTLHASSQIKAAEIFDAAMHLRGHTLSIESSVPFIVPHTDNLAKEHASAPGPVYSFLF